MNIMTTYLDTSNIDPQFGIEMNTACDLSSGRVAYFAEQAVLISSCLATLRSCLLLSIVHVGLAQLLSKLTSDNVDRTTEQTMSTSQ